MPQAVKGYDAQGHPNDAFTQVNAGFTTATTGTAAGTIVQPGTADPTGTTNITAPFCVADGYGSFQITTAGTQTTGALRTIYFQYPYGVARPVMLAITTTAGVAAGGTLTTVITNTSLAISVGTALTTATTYNVAYAVM